MPSSVPSDTNSKLADFAEAEQPKRTLLIVDDEEGPRQSLRVVFKQDYNLLMAEDGISAIELAKKNKIDAAILDIRMVGMSGIDLLGQLKSLDPDIEVIMLTAYETIESLRQALRYGAYDFLNKPFDIATIRSAVTAAIERRSLAAEIRNNSQKLQGLQVELQTQRLEQEIVKNRGEIYASVIHDINGPITVISGLIQMINQRIGDAADVSGKDLEMVKDRLKRITRQVTNCIEISRRYLGFLKQHSGEPVRVLVNQTLVDLGELLKVHPYTKKNQLVIQPLAEEAAVQVNGTDLIQILLNLALNALQCSEQLHRVEIRGEIQPQPLDLSHFVDGPEDLFVNREGFNNQAPLVALTIQDDGPGIAPEVLPKIFQSYFTTKVQGQNTGLGLSIVHRLLREAHGALHAHTKAGRGTLMTVYLPSVVSESDKQT
ncbi:MAG TPA: response regulator [Candidatus Eisenbacteria bacterium]|nr:response regulator [Candidatus Eisenbacteria bacterium]